PAYHLVKSSPVAYVKLGGILVHGFLFHISSYRSPGTSADLGNAQIQDFFPALLGFPGRYDHSCVGNGNADHSYDLLERFVRNRIGKVCRVNVVRRTDSRNADGMRSYAEPCLQMLRMHKDPHEII